MHLSRRSFFLGAGALVAAPSIVRASSLMPVKVPKFVPEAWLVCDGRAVLKSQYPKLFKVIGYGYGGDGQSFNLPDLRARVVRDTFRSGDSSDYVIAADDRRESAFPIGALTMRYNP